MGDKPLFYQTASGREMSLELHYKGDLGLNSTNDSRNPAIFSVGKNWSTPWRSYAQRSGIYNGGDDGTLEAYYLVLGDGSVRLFPQNRTEQYTRAVLTKSGDELTLTFPSGAKNVYGQYVTLSNQSYIFLTRKLDASSNQVTYGYNFVTSGGLTNAIRLHDITDENGNGFSFNYTNTGPYGSLLSYIESSFGDAQLSYDGDGRLVAIQDSEGILSRMTYYSDEGLISTLATPYGTNSFTFITTNGTRAVLVDEYGLRQQLYLGGHDRADVLTTALSESAALNTFIGSSSTVQTNSFDSRTTFLWGPRQFQNLSSSIRTSLTNGTFNPTNLTTNELKLGWTKHWLRGRTQDITDTNVILSSCLSVERAPSPDDDGTTEGLLTWYDYEGKNSSGSSFQGHWEYAGMSRQPMTIASRLPGGEWQVTRHSYNSMGKATNTVQTYSVVNKGALDADYYWTNTWRTNIYLYATNDIDLVSEHFAAGSDIHLHSSNVFNSFHQVVTNFNAVGEVTYYEYNASHQVTKMTNAAGLIADYAYSGGYLASVVDKNASQNLRTNEFTWDKGLLKTRKDPRGSVLTNFWDTLGRLAGTANEVGRTTNLYQNLDLVLTIDRMGFTNGFAYNRFRQMTHHTNANGRVTTYQYCNCGVLESTVDALGHTISHTHDNLGRTLRTTLPDTSWSESTYDLFGRVVRTADSAGSKRTNYFLLNGLIARAESALGTVSRLIYDAEDRATNSLEGNGVLTIRTFDPLGRILSSATVDYSPDPFNPAYWTFHTEQFGYSARGLIAHTNPLGKITRYFYDELGRKTIETNALGDRVQFAYAPAGDLITLTNEKNQVTTWKYDVQGRVTNKLDALGTNIFRYGYDANGRLTNRWTPAKGTTGYSYDAVGNLTNVDYAVSTDLRFKYDALNRLTNLLDAVGTTVYGYTNFGALLFEDGPWENDAVSYTYTNRMRSGLTMAQATGAAWTQGYGYDKNLRLQSLSSPAGTFTYGYRVPVHIGDVYPYVGTPSSIPLDLAGSLIESLGLPNGSTITNAHDVLGRLTATHLRTSGHTLLNQHEYAYDAAHRRTRQTRTGGNFVDYVYDDIGQVKSARGLESGGTTNRVHEQFAYVYDAAGNLNYRTNNTLAQTFGVDSLNQLTSGSRSGNATVAGATTMDASSVTVNANGGGALSAIRYADRSFARTNVTLVNGDNTFVATAQDSLGRTDTDSETVNLPSSASYVYDQNGNLLSDGRRHFTYDDENQLTQVVVTNSTKSEFTYDGKMRRRVRKESLWANAAWRQILEVRYVYDGNLVLQERHYDSPLGTPFPQQTVSYTRGLDLSGSIQGAGGIGGLLARTESVNGNQQSAFYHADAVGNVTALADTNQTVVARYLYDPFGGLLAMSGALAEANLYRFSSKEAHEQSGLVYYLYRFYDPNLQRWPNRDPIGEYGGRNLYRFVLNDPIDGVDAWGLFVVGGPAPGKNTVVCDGKGGFEIQLGGTGNKQQTGCLSDCMRKHEQSHIDDIKKANPDICKGKSKGLAIAPSSDAERTATERKASQAEIDCLKDLQKNCPKGCDQIIKDRIKQMEGYRDSFK